MTVKQIAITLTAVLAFSGLTACGGSTDAYCDALQATSDSAEADGGDPQARLKRFEAVAAQAPRELEGDWKIVIEGMRLMTEDSANAAAVDQPYFKALENIMKHAANECAVEMPTL